MSYYGISGTDQTLIFASLLEMLCIFQSPFTQAMYTEFLKTYVCGHISIVFLIIISQFEGGNKLRQNN